MQAAKESFFPLSSIRLRLFLCLVVYLCLAIGYGVINPLFEAPDEHSHFFTVLAVKETGRLPFIDVELDPWMGQEAAQPPLYYVLGSIIVAPIETAGAREQVWLNPLPRLGDASLPTNINAFVHTPAEKWPWRGYAPAAHLLRLVSTLMGLGTLLCIYAAGRLLWPTAPLRAWLATAIIAFLPQFAFVHASISNDPLIILLCSAALLQLLRLWRGPITTARLVALGLTIGLAALTKTAGLLLLVYSAGMVAVFTLQHNDRRWRPVLTNLALVVVPALLLSGWLLWRNWQLYGDVTAANQFVRHFGGSRDYSLGQVLAEMGGLWHSLFAVFGWFNVRAPLWVYWVWNGLVALAVAGGLWKWVAGSKWQGFHPSSLILHPSSFLPLWFLLVYAGLVAFLLQTPGAQGRLLFPAVLPLALAMGYGLASRVRVGIAAVGLALATNVYCLLLVIPAAYANPPVIAAGEIPAEAMMYDEEIGQGLTLLAGQVETREARPGEEVWLTLYWRAATAPTTASEVVVELFGRDGVLAGKFQGYHGGGLYPANLWPAGAVLADRIPLRLDEAMAVPARVIVRVRLVGGPVSLAVGEVKVVPAKWPDVSGPPLATAGEGIDVMAASVAPLTAAPGESVRLRVVWRVRAAPGRDLTTFVHLGEPDQPPLATGDSPPLNGDYPTRLWAAGEVIEDVYTLIVPAGLPSGDYPIWMGLYEPQTGAPLPLAINGVPQPSNSVLVGRIVVTP